MNPKIVKELEEKGMKFVGHSEDGERMEIMELDGTYRLEINIHLEISIHLEIRLYLEIRLHLEIRLCLEISQLCI